MKRFMAGLQILYKHDPDGEISASHDEVYVDGPQPDQLSKEEIQTLEDNGWSWDVTTDSWHKFV